MNITSKQNELDSSRFTEHLIEGRGLDSIASIGPDGKISLRLDLKELAKEVPDDHAANVIEFATDFKWRECPSLSILIMIVGSRGDVQPYLALGQQLKKDGHRVRLATHETFREIVVDAGLEFFCIGGNPQDLMSYMVKNPGLMPGFESLTNGDIVRKRKMLTEMINGCWRACHKPAEDGPFVADAIISNPPSFAHVHCAEALGIPLLLSFTMPWSPTTSFPHPLVNVSSANAGSWTTNIMSYAASEMMQWQGVGDLVNEFRTTTLGLAPLSLRLGAGLVDRLKIPWTYCMSPALVPKPGDWKNFIDVVGFYFLDLGTKYTPKEDLAAFLKAGEPPVYIGFGSVVVDNPEAMTQIIFEATKQAGVRALVSAGWGGLGGTTIPSHVFILGNVPHDWLFDQDRVAAVVHHGGAGTTAIGLAKGRPTVVVPFFGDQGFWGSMIHKAGAGPEPIPQKDLNIEILRDAITYAISPPAKEAAARLSRKILSEDGARKGAESFYRHLPLLNMRCDLDPTKVAIWWSQEHFMKLSSLAAQVLVDAKIITMDSLTIHRPKEYKATKMLTPYGIYATANSLFWNLTNGPIPWKDRDVRGLASSVADVFMHAKSLIATTQARNKVANEQKAKDKEEKAKLKAERDKEKQKEKEERDREKQKKKEEREKEKQRVKGEKAKQREEKEKAKQNEKEEKAKAKARTATASSSANLSTDKDKASEDKKDTRAKDESQNTKVDAEISDKENSEKEQEKDAKTPVGQEEAVKKETSDDIYTKEPDKNEAVFLADVESVERQSKASDESTPSTSKPSTPDPVKKPTKPGKTASTYKQSKEGQSQIQRIRRTRIEQSIEVFKNSTDEQQALILQRFDESVAELPTRKLKYANLLKEADTASGETPKGTPSASTTSIATKSIQSESLSSSSPRLPPRPKATASTPSSSLSKTAQKTSDEAQPERVITGFEETEDEKFHREMEEAIKASSEGH